MCDHGCGLDVFVEAGRPVALKGATKHPFNRGWLCAKGRRALDFFYSQERLKTPLIRSKGGFVPLDWNAALDIAAERLHALRNQYGPENLAIYQGEGIGHQEIKYYMKRFANVYGTPNFMGVGSTCNASRTLAETLTFGALTKPDIAATKFLIVWGGNPFVSHEPLPPMEISRLKKRGGRLIVVDPRKTETASKADMHLPIKPGRDEILILSMLHVLFQEALWDKDFTKKWVHEYQRFFRMVSADRFSPENGESWTGIEPELVRRMTRAYAKAKPACIFTGNGLEHHSHGVNAMRLLAIVKAISGNLDIPGGECFIPRPRLRDITAPLPAPAVPPIGAERFPLFCKARKEAHALSLPEAVLKHRPYPIKGMVIAGGNPTIEWPESARTRQAIEALDFLMVIDVVASPDSHYADIILPACTFLERAEHRVNVYQNLPCITLRRQVVPPVYGLPDQLIWIRLAQRMGFGEWFPWTTCEEGIDELLGDLNLSYKEIASQGGLYAYETRRYKKYESRKFQTPSGKVEIFSGRLSHEGYDPSPVREHLFEEFQNPEQFPLLLSTGGNLLGFLHWQYRYVPRLRRMAPEPICEIHPLTAKHHGLSDGQFAKIETPYGSIRLRARMSPRIREDTIHMPQGWTEANANELTSAENLDSVSGFPNLKSLPCRVEAT